MMDHSQQTSNRQAASMAESTETWGHQALAWIVGMAMLEGES
jgi:hypothetical protein